jgi:hypothetical protein
MASGGRELPAEAADDAIMGAEQVSSRLECYFSLPDPDLISSILWRKYAWYGLEGFRKLNLGSPSFSLRMRSAKSMPEI